MANDIWNVAFTGKEDTSGGGDYPVANPGKYEFEVVKATLKEYTPKAGSKIPRCAELDVQLKFEGIAEGKDVNVFDRLYFAEKTIWKAAAFAKCIGVFKEGMTPKDLMNACAKEIGMAEIGVREYNGKKQNDIKKYYEKEEADVINSDGLPF